MPESVSKITSASIAQGLADRYPNDLPVFKQGSDYYTYTDIAASDLTGTQYTNVTISDVVVNGTLPVVPQRKMFPR